MTKEELRASIAEVLEIIARDGLPGSKDLDVALDAIWSDIQSFYAANCDREEG